MISDKMAQDILRCSVCPNEVRVHCRSCDENFCRECSGKHVSEQDSKKHEIIPYRERMINTLIHPSCSEHPNQKCEVKCINCDKVVCAKCIITKHSKHQMEEIEEIVLQKKKSILEDVEVFNKALFEFENMEKEAEKRILELSGEFADLENAISIDGDTLQKNVEEIVQKARDEAKTHKTNCISQMESFLGNLTERKNILLEKMREKKALISENVAMSILLYKRDNSLARVPPKLENETMTFLSNSKIKQDLEKVQGTVTTSFISESLMQVYALYDFHDGEIDVLSCEAGEQILVDRNSFLQDDDNWYMSTRCRDGKFGFLPKNYLGRSECRLIYQLEEWWCPIGRKGAMCILMSYDVPPGTFLLSRDKYVPESEMTLSYRTESIDDGAKVQHVSIETTDDDTLYFTTDNVFPDLPSLIQHYREFKTDEMVCKLSSPLRQMLPSKSFNGYEIERKCIQKQDYICSGRHYEIFRGLLEPCCNFKVALHIYKLPAVCPSTLTFSADDVQEGAEKLLYLSHENIIHVIGMCTKSFPIVMVTEHIEKGLLQHLQSEEQQSTLSDIINVCLQICKGMAYIHRKSVVHCDLRAGNIMFGDENRVKIAGFQNSQILSNDPEDCHEDRKFAIKWMPPEVLFDKIYGTKADVWSFGALQYEIFSLGLEPFKDVTRDEYLKKMRNGLQIPKPKNAFVECPDLYYNIMTHCCMVEFTERPSFEILCQVFEQFFATKVKNQGKRKGIFKFF